jgi:hypothetical protein
VLPGNAPAVALYRRMGFEFSTELGEPLSDGVTSELVMVKPLRGPDNTGRADRRRPSAAPPTPVCRAARVGRIPHGLHP